MKVLIYLLKINIWDFFKPLLTQVMIKSVDHSQATHISYTFLVVDYGFSTATLS